MRNHSVFRSAVGHRARYPDHELLLILRRLFSPFVNRYKKTPLQLAGVFRIRILT